MNFDLDWYSDFNTFRAFLTDKYEYSPCFVVKMMGGGSYDCDGLKFSNYKAVIAQGLPCKNPDKDINGYSDGDIERELCNKALNKYLNNKNLLRYVFKEIFDYH